MDISVYFQVWEKIFFNNFVNILQSKKVTRWLQFDPCCLHLGRKRGQDCAFVVVVVVVVAAAGSLRLVMLHIAEIKTTPMKKLEI